MDRHGPTAAVVDRSHRELQLHRPLGRQSERGFERELVNAIEARPLGGQERHLDERRAGQDRRAEDRMVG